jgi:hypothetical protein
VPIQERQAKYKIKKTGRQIYSKSLPTAFHSPHHRTHVALLLGEAQCKLIHERIPIEGGEAGEVVHAAQVTLGRLQ